MPDTERSPRLDPLPPEHLPELKEEFDSFLRRSASCRIAFSPCSASRSWQRPSCRCSARSGTREQGRPRPQAAGCARGEPDRGRPLQHGAYGERRAAFRCRGGQARGDPRLPDERSVRCRPSARRFDFAMAASATPNAVSDTIFAVLHQYWTEEQIVEIAGVTAMAGSCRAGTSPWPRHSRRSRRTSARDISRPTVGAPARTAGDASSRRIHDRRPPCHRSRRVMPARRRRHRRTGLLGGPAVEKLARCCSYMPGRLCSDDFRSRASHGFCGTGGCNVEDAAKSEGRAKRYGA